MKHQVMTFLYELPDDYDVSKQRFFDIFTRDYWIWVWNELNQQSADMLEFLSNANKIAFYLQNPQAALLTFINYGAENKEFLMTTATVGAFLYIIGVKKVGAKIGWGSVIAYAVLGVLAAELRQ